MMVGLWSCSIAASILGKIHSVGLMQHCYPQQTQSKSSSYPQLQQRGIYNWAILTLINAVCTRIMYRDHLEVIHLFYPNTAALLSSFLHSICFLHVHLLFQPYTLQTKLSLYIFHCFPQVGWYRYCCVVLGPVQWAPPDPFLIQDFPC